MTIQEERSLLENKLQSTTGKKQQAGVILEILKQFYSIYNGKEDVYVDRLLKLSRELKSGLYEGWVHYYRANISWASGDYGAASKENEQAESLFKKHRSAKALGYAGNLWGKIYFRQGKFNEALSKHIEALELLRSTGDKFAMAKAHSGAGLTYMNLRNFGEALTHFAQAKELREETNDKRGLANSYSDMGVAYQNQNNFAEALELHFASKKIREELDDKEGLAHSYENIGMVYRHQENYPEALANLFACLEIREATQDSHQHIEDKPGIAAVYNMIGVVYTLQGKPAEALGYLQTSLAINRSIGFKEGIARALHNTGRVHYEQKDYPQALHYAMQALEILKEINASLGICGSQILLGRVYTAMADFRTGAAYLEAGLTMTDKIHSKILRKEALEALYELNKSSGDSMAALSFLEQFRQAEKELSSEETAKRITGLEWRHRLEKKEQEVAFERQKKETLETANELLAKEKQEAERQQQRAEHSERVKQMFLANMSHEIRTPMNAIMGMTNLLLSNPSEKENRDYLNAIKHSSDSLLVVINDILDLSKIEAGKLELENIPFSLKNQLKGLEQMFALKAREKKLKFSLALPKSLSPGLTGDPNRLNQVLINLLGNAFKFTHKGKVSLTVKALPDNRYRFAVADTGIGIAPGKLSLIFENFSQADSGTTRKYGGTGLGLGISKQLVERMGGAIGVKSKPGKGSEFSFTIPLPPAKTGLRNTSAKSKTPIKVPAGLRILLAEDNEYNQIVAAAMLKKMLNKPRVAIARTGKEVLQKLKKQHYDLILMDIHMPLMDGYTAAKKIRTGFSGKKKQIPIIALTASVLKADLDSCMKAGMNGYLHKPFKPEDLLAEVAKHIRGNNTAPRKAPVAKRMAAGKNGKGSIDETYLRNLTANNKTEIAEYVDIFLKFAPAQVHKINDAIRAGDSSSLYKALHGIKPQLKIMGALGALKKIEGVEAGTRNAKKTSAAIKGEAAAVCRDIEEAISYWKERNENLN